MERLIPLRFIQMLPCDPTQAGCNDDVDAESLLLNVQNMNRVWRKAGIQFAIRSLEHYWMPTFANLDEPPPPGLLWSAVKAELRLPFPSMPVDAWQDTEPKWKGDWIRSVAAIYAPASELTVWIKKTGNGGNQTWLPEWGRSLRMDGPDMDKSAEPYHFAHEVGHYLGLAHTWEDNALAHDPSTWQIWKRSDYWDLVYKPGTSGANPHVFYNSHAAAVADEASLQLIEKQPCKVHCSGYVKNCSNPPPPPGCDEAECGHCVNCGVCPCSCFCGCAPGECTSCLDGGAGWLTCHVGESSAYSETWATGAAPVKGLAFAFSTGTGPNVISYNGNFRTHPYGVSDSQIQMVRKELRWDAPFNSDSVNVIYRNFRYNQATLSGRRPDLGSWNPRQPAQRFDFDGDGKRDLGFWVPPTTLAGTGQVTVLLSSHGYSQTPGQYLSVAFGGLGDIPVPGNYADNTGDVARTDVAFFQPGGGINRDSPYDQTGWWRWCKTANPAESTTCSSPSAYAYGARFDVPEPGLDFDGVAPDEFSVYRPSEGNWYATYSGFGWVKQISTAQSGAVPLAGLYDCDGQADVAVHKPSTAQFKLLRSENGWDVAQKITRQFDVNFIPQPSGTTTDRCGALPLAGMTAPRYCCYGRICYNVPRLTAWLWFPQAGTFNYTDLLQGTVTSCYYGASDDMPVPAVDRNSDLRSDMAFYRARTADTAGSLFAKATSNVLGNCSGTDYGSYSIPGVIGPGQRVFGVSDMTGDGIGEVLIWDPDDAVVRWLTSESGFTTGGSVNFGDSSMELL